MNNKKMLKDSFGLVGFGVVTGLGASMVNEAGGNATGLNTLSKASVPLASIIGSSIIMDSLKDLRRSAKFK